MITPQTTAVLMVPTPLSAGPNIYRTCIPIMESAHAMDIRLRWLALREVFSTPLNEKCRRFLDYIPFLEGITHAFLIEAPLVTFHKPLEDMCEAVSNYKPGTVYAEATLTLNTPYNNKDFTDAVLNEGVKHDSRILFGDIPSLKEYCEILPELSREYLADLPKPGLATTCALDEKDFQPNLVQYAEDTQFLSLLASVYYPDKIVSLPMFFGTGPLADPDVIPLIPSDAVTDTRRPD